MCEDDIELTVAALKACGYRVKLREKNYTRWVTATKGLQVQFKHWHPLTNINQAMQLLMDADLVLTVNYFGAHVRFMSEAMYSEPTPQDLINAQCRAIVNACASLKAVR